MCKLCVKSTGRGGKGKKDREVWQRSRGRNKEEGTTPTTNFTSHSLHVRQYFSSMHPAVAFKTEEPTQGNREYCVLVQLIHVCVHSIHVNNGVV